MADIKLNYISNGADQIKKDYEIIKRETKKISESPVKITMKSDGVQEAINAFGRLRVEIPKLEQSYNSLQNKNSTVAKTMLKDINSLKSAFEDLNNIINKQGRVSGNVFDNFKNSGQLEATLNSERHITEELEKQQKIRQSQERELNTLREQLQGVSRTLSDQQNALFSGKKGKTPYDIANLLQQLEQGKARAEELALALGEDNEAVQHFRNGMAWTEANNPLRALRDEAYKLIPEMSKLQQEITKLKKSGENESLLSFDKNRLAELQQQFAEIEKTFQESINILGKDSYYGQYINDIQQTLILLQQQLNKETEIRVGRQQALNDDAAKAQKEKEYISLLQQKFQLENKITRLSKDKQSTKANQNQIAEYKRQIELINQKLQGIQKETRFTEQTKKKVDDLTTAHKNEQAAIKAKNKDLDKSNSLLSDSLKNFAKFTLYYQSLMLLRQGIQQAIDTMKDLDAAFTDIRIVTNQSAEETAQLAQEYNALAKEMGSTTTQVAEGASEWLRQGKSAEETTTLLKASMTLSKVGAIEASQATELLTSSLNGYKIEAKDAMSVVDKISSIDLEAATSSEELATALARTANVANDSEVSFNKLLGMIGTVSSVTRRSASTIRRSI